jgi:hypothetical protein
MLVEKKDTVLLQLLTKKQATYKGNSKEVWFTAAEGYSALLGKNLSRCKEHIVMIKWDKNKEQAFPELYEKSAKHHHSHDALYMTS